MRQYMWLYHLMAPTQLELILFDVWFPAASDVLLIAQKGNQKRKWNPNTLNEQIFYELRGTM